MFAQGSWEIIPVYIAITNDGWYDVRRGGLISVKFGGPIYADHMHTTIEIYAGVAIYYHWLILRNKA